AAAAAWRTLRANTSLEDLAASGLAPDEIRVLDDVRRVLDNGDERVYFTSVRAQVRADASTDFRPTLAPVLEFTMRRAESDWIVVDGRVGALYDDDAGQIGQPDLQPIPAEWHFSRFYRRGRSRPTRNLPVRDRGCPGAPD